MSTREAEETAEGTDPRRWRALIVTLAGGFMVLLDVTIVTVAVPSIQRGLGATASGVQWVISGYPLMFGLALVAGGRLGDAFGRRRMYLISLTGFVLTSALAGAAPTITLLIVARLLQGLAGGLITPQNTGLVQDLFRGAERGRAFGIFGATVGLSTAVGPVVGGLIINAFGATDGWRWVFYVNVPIGALAVLLAARLLPRTSRKVGASEIDVVGIVLLGLSVLCVLFPVVQSESGGLRRQWWLFPLAVLLLYAFLRWERHRAAVDRPPVLDFRLFRATPGYPSGAVLGAVYFAGFSGIWLVFALFYQTGEHLSALQSGLAVTPFALGSAVSSAVAGRLVDRWRRWVTTTGLAMVVLGLAATAWVVAVAPPGRVAIWALLPLLVAGVGGGAVIAPNTTLALANVPTRMAGVAGGLIQTGQRITSAIGTALMAAIYHAVATGIRFAAGLAAALLSAVGLVLIALVLAVRELRAERRWHPAD
jgi:EmrB/QacA subfamily drug resistance transporter